MWLGWLNFKNAFIDLITKELEMCLLPGNFNAFDKEKKLILVIIVSKNRGRVTFLRGKNGLPHIFNRKFVFILIE